MKAVGTQGQGLVDVSTGSPEHPGHVQEPADRDLLQRFIAQHDESAFAALVARHGPMVLAVCRRVLGNGPDADDAFQATFFILVQKAASITQPELLSNWLFGVAVRTARKARTAAARRAHHERQVVPVASPAPPDSDWDDLRSLLDEELEQLPHKYRAPLVLCYLDGLTNEEAARLLGWPIGSISYRLARGRELLRQRLSRRAAFAPVLFPALLADLTPEPLSPALADSTVQTAMTLAQGGTLAATVSPAVRHLVEGGQKVSRAGLVTLVVAVLLTLLVAVAGIAASSELSSASAGNSSQPSETSGTGGCGCR